MRTKTNRLPVCLFVSPGLLLDSFSACPSVMFVNDSCIAHCAPKNCVLAHVLPICSLKLNSWAPVAFVFAKHPNRSKADPNFAMTSHKLDLVYPRWPAGGG